MLVYQLYRFAIVLAYCIFFSSELEHTFFSIYMNWGIYSWWKNDIQLLQSDLWIFTTVITIIFVIARIRDELPFWITCVIFSAWIFQILLLISIFIPITGLIGNGLGQAYSSFVANVDRQAFEGMTTRQLFGFFGVILGIGISFVYFYREWKNNSLGWVCNLLQSRALRLSKFVSHQSGLLLSLGRPKWILACIFVSSFVVLNLINVK